MATTGVQSIQEKKNLLRRSDSVTILMYHRIGETRDGYEDPSIVVSPLNFERQIRYLASRRNVISLGEYVSSVSYGTPLPPNSIIITFDDGFKDNFTYAYPVLREAGLPATFFLATAFIGTGQVTWESRLGHLMGHGVAQELVAELSILPGEREVFQIATEKERRRATNELLELLSAVTMSERQTALDKMQAQLELDCDQEVMLSWDDVREMAETPGITFGSHSVTHNRLPALATPEVQDEIVESKRHIEAEIGKEVTLFAYPYGDFAYSDNRTRDILKANGFDCAVTTVYGRNDSNSDLFALKRVMADNAGGIRFQLGMSARAQIGEPLKSAINWWKTTSRRGQANIFRV